MRSVRQTAIVVVLAAVPHLLLAQRAAVPPQDPTTLVNANIVNVLDGTIVPNATIVLRDGTIVSVGAGAAAAGTTVIDVGGRYVVPGLFDGHTHITNLRAARTALESGVTTVRSAGVSGYVDVGLRELVKNGAVAGPDVLAAGYHVTPHLAEEAFLGDPALSPFLSGGIKTAEAVRQVVRANLARGVDWIKTHATERAGLPETDPRRQVYTVDEIKVMVDEAGAKGIPVMAHAHGEEGALAAVQAGVRSIEHGTYLSDEALRLMAQKGTYLVTTYSIVVDTIQPGGEFDNVDLMLRGRHMLPRMRETIQKAIKLNVKIVAATDTLYGPNSVARISHEVAALAEMGMTPLQALQSATTVAAEMLGMGSRAGAIQPGLEADLLVVERNPLEQIRTLDDPLLVMTNGRVVTNRLSFGRGKSGTNRTAGTVVMVSSRGSSQSHDTLLQLQARVLGEDHLSYSSAVVCSELMVGVGCLKRLTINEALVRALPRAEALQLGAGHNSPAADPDHFVTAWREFERRASVARVRRASHRQEARAGARRWQGRVTGPGLEPGRTRDRCYRS